MPTRTQTSVGMETVDQTTERAREMLARSEQSLNEQQPEATVTQEQAGQMNLRQLSSALSPTPTQPTQDDFQQAEMLDFPEPQAPGTAEQFMGSITGQVERQRAELDTRLATRRDEIRTEESELRQERDRLMSEVGTLTQPFREELERKERERFQVEQNFDANQRLIGELETLLTEGNNLIRMQQGLPVNQRVVNARMNNAMRDVQARAGVLEAVYNARNNQIQQGLQFIDRTRDAIVADRQDSLMYYETLLKFNQEGLLNLRQEDRELAQEELNLVKRDLDRAEQTADYIKSLMIDPNTAQFMADAGVTMTDSVEEINLKMRNQTAVIQREGLINELASNGFEQVPAGTTGAGVTTFYVNGEPVTFRVIKGSMTDLQMEQVKSNIQYQQFQQWATSEGLRLQEAGIQASNLASQAELIRNMTKDGRAEVYSRVEFKEAQTVSKYQSDLDADLKAQLGTANREEINWKAVSENDALRYSIATSLARASMPDISRVVSPEEALQDTSIPQQVRGTINRLISGEGISSDLLANAVRSVDARASNSYERLNFAINEISTVHQVPASVLPGVQFSQAVTAPEAARELDSIVFSLQGDANFNSLDNLWSSLPALNQ